MLFLWILFAVAVSAQDQTNGAIEGTVTDNGTAVIPGATIKVTDSTGALTKTATSDEEGKYKIADLPAGNYTVTVTLDGFQEYKTENLVLAAGQTVKMDATLLPATVATKVEVTSSTVGQVETSNSQVSNTLTSTEVTTYQLNGRNFTALIALAPGVSNQTGQDEALVGVKGSVNYSVNGGRTEYNAYDVDGGDILNASLNKSSSTLIVYPSIDAVADLQVLTSNYGAQYGRSASGTILVTTKSGTNAFHGTGYLFVRNNIFNARNFFDQTIRVTPNAQISPEQAQKLYDETKGAPLYQKYDLGTTIGGPIYIPGHYNVNKDKTFFFFSEEWRHDKEPITINQGVPSAQEHDCRLAINPSAQCLNPTTPGVYADFSDVCPASSSELGSVQFSRVPGQPNYFPDCPSSTFTRLGTQPATFTGNLVYYGPNNPYTSTLLPSNQVPHTLEQLGFVPLPNSPTGCNSSIHSCYVASPALLTTDREELFRIDHNFSSTQKFYMHYIHDQYETINGTPLYAFIANSFPTIQNDVKGPGTSVSAHLQSTFHNTFVNDLSMHFTTDHITISAIPGPGVSTVNRPGSASDSPPCPPPTTDTFCGIGSIFDSGNIPGFNFGGKAPGLLFLGTETAYGGKGFAVDTGFSPWKHSNPTYSPREDATWIVKNHTLQFGVLAILAQRNEINPPVGSNIGDVQGLATFKSNSNTLSTGNSWADFVLGVPQSFEQTSAQSKYYQRYTIVEPYFQDDWKVTPRLTLNMGLRVSLFGTYSEKNNRVFNWLQSEYDPVLASQVYVFSGVNSQGNSPAGANGGLYFKGTEPPNGIPVPLNPLSLDPHLTNGVVRCGVSTVKSGIHVPSSCMFGHLFNPAPRIGFAWDPFGKGKTSVRGGYGVFFEHGTGNEANTGSLEGSIGNYGDGGVIDMTQFYPGTWASIGSSGGSYPLNFTQIPKKAIWPYVQQWNFSVQEQLPAGLLGSVAYVGSKGTHLTAELQTNQLRPLDQSLNPYLPGQPITSQDCQVSFDNSGNRQFTIGISPLNPLGTAVVTQANPAYLNLATACSGLNGTDPRSYANRGNSLAPSLGAIYSLQNVANSSYHALQATLRRTKGPLTLGVSYTYSHSLDDSSDRSSTVFVNAYDLKQNRASSDFDQRHLLNVSYIYDLPFRSLLQHLTHWSDDDPTNTASSKINYESSAMKRWLDGWQLSGITIFTTGTPFSVLNGGSPGGISTLDNAGVDAVNGPGSYPDVVKNAPSIAVGAVNSSNTFGPLLGNPNRFVAPQGLTYGNAGRNILNNPKRTNFDMSLLKSFQFGERYSMQFRLEAFNVFNHTQFRIYDPSNVGNTGNNVITCYGAVNNSAGDPSCVASSSFLHPVNAHRPRTIQLGLKFFF